MPNPFVPAGPRRYVHQMRGLRKLIETGGRCALLFDPGTGKTATALDYASLLALKSPVREARVLVVAPLAALDTWVGQAEIFVHDDVSVWAEALGGSIRRRASSIAARGGHPLPDRLADYGRTKKGDHSGSAGHRSAQELFTRAGAGGTAPGPENGPQALPGPRMILLAVNLDAFASRAQVRGSSKTAVDLMIDAVRAFGPDLLIADESHRLKSASSNTSRALARLTPHVRRRVLLTGTVMPHSPLDVYGQWRFLDPKAFGHQGRNATFGGFKSRYAQMGGWQGKEVIGFQRLDEMQDIMARNSVVARKEDALDLPKTTDVIVPVDLSQAERKAYSDMRKDLAFRLKSGALSAADNRLTQLMRLRQITSGFIHDTDSGVTEVLGDAKARTIRSIVHDNLAGEQRVVVFAQFRREIDLLADRLAEKGTEIDVITGATASADRREIRRRFGDTNGHPERRVLIAQVRTMSLAVNELVTASHAVYGSLSQQRDDFVQSRDRLNRVGQTRPITFWYALARNTVDDVVMMAHRNRTSLEAAMLHHIEHPDSDARAA